MGEKVGLAGHYEVSVALRKMGNHWAALDKAVMCCVLKASPWILAETRMKKTRGEQGVNVLNPSEKGWATPGGGQKCGGIMHVL